MNSVFNGMYSSGDIYKYTNAHIFYKNRSIIIDYEHALHAYPKHIEESTEFVPFEVYPYDGDVYVGHVKLDPNFHKADIADLIRQLEELEQKETIV